MWSEYVVLIYTDKSTSVLAEHLQDEIYKKKTSFCPYYCPPECSLEAWATSSDSKRCVYPREKKNLGPVDL